MKRTLLFAAIAFAIAMSLVAGYTTMRQNEMTRSFGELVEVVVAKDNIPEYGLIRSDQLATATINKKFVQPQTIVLEKNTDLNGVASELIGKSAYVNIYSGEQITLTKLIHQDGKPVLDKQLEKDNRAITIQIAPHTGVGRLIRPGNKVDILIAAKYERDQKPYIEVKTVFQNVLVLATGKAVVNSVPTRVSRAVLSSLEAEFEAQRRKDLYQTNLDPSTTGRPDDNYNTLTVQLPTGDAEKLILLQNEYGDQSLYFTLRNNADESPMPLQTTLLDQVIGPDSAQGRSKIKAPEFTPPEPKYFDSIGGKLEPKY